MPKIYQISLSSKIYSTIESKANCRNIVGTRGVHTTRWPAQPARLARNWSATTRTDQSDSHQQVATHRTWSLRVSWWVSSLKTRATRPDHEISKIWQDPKVFWQRASWNPLQSTRSNDIFDFLSKSNMKSTRSSEI